MPDPVTSTTPPPRDAAAPSIRERLIAYLDDELSDDALATIAEALVRRAMYGDFGAVELLLRIEDAPREETPR